MDEKFLQQKDRNAMGSSLPLVSNIVMEYFEKLALDTTLFEPSL
jgi:hypothetical protein